MTIFDCAADRPQVAGVLTTLPPDPERERLTEIYRGSTVAVTATKSRQAQLHGDADQITVAMANNPTAKERQSFIDRQAALSAEMAMLPQVLTLQAEQFGQALASWYVHVERQLRTAIVRANGEIEVLYSERAPHQRTLRQAKSSTGAARDMAAQVAVAKEALASTNTQVSALEGRRDGVDRAWAALRSACSNAFGQDARETGPHPNDIDRFVMRITTPVAA